MVIIFVLCALPKALNDTHTDGACYLHDDRGVSVVKNDVCTTLTSTEVKYVNTGCGICSAVCGANFKSKQYIKFQSQKWGNIFKFCNFYLKQASFLGLVI